MNQRFISVLIFAFVVAGCASLLLYRLTTNHGSAQAAPATTKALVASRNLELGVIIKDSDVKDTPWLGSLPATAVLKREDIIGRGVTTTIYDGEPILENRLAPVEVRPAPPVRQSFVMEVINGGKRSESKFDTTPEVK